MPAMSALAQREKLSPTQMDSAIIFKMPLTLHNCTLEQLWSRHLATRPGARGPGPADVAGKLQLKGGVIIMQPDLCFMHKVFSLSSSQNDGNSERFS